MSSRTGIVPKGFSPRHQGASSAWLVIPLKDEQRHDVGQFYATQQDHIIAIARFNMITHAIGDHQIIARATDQTVITRATHQAIISPLAIQRITARIT
jgi:hypothetical protein